MTSDEERKQRMLSKIEERLLEGVYSRNDERLSEAALLARLLLRQSNIVVMQTCNHHCGQSRPIWNFRLRAQGQTSGNGFFKRCLDCETLDLRVNRGYITEDEIQDNITWGEAQHASLVDLQVAIDFVESASGYQLLKRCAATDHIGDRLVPIEEFNKNRTRDDGKQVYCKVCDANARRLNHSRNKVKGLVAELTVEERSLLIDMLQCEPNS